MNPPPHSATTQLAIHHQVDFEANNVSLLVPRHPHLFRVTIAMETFQWKHRSSEEKVPQHMWWEVHVISGGRGMFLPGFT